MAVCDKNSDAMATHTLSNFFESNVTNVCHRVVEQLDMTALPWHFAVKALGLEIEPDIKQSLVGPEKVSIALIGTREHAILLSQSMVMFNESNLFKIEAGVYIYTDKHEAYDFIMKKGIARSEALGVTMYAKEVSLEHLLDEANLDNPEEFEKIIETNTHAYGFAKGRKEHTCKRNIILQFDRVVINMVMLNMKGDDNSLFAHLILRLAKEWAQNTQRLIAKGWNVWLQELWVQYGSLYTAGDGVQMTSTQMNKDVYDHFMANYSCACCGKQPETRKDHQKCAKCKQTYYCGRDCQKKHWSQHKHTCGRGSDAAVPA